MNLILTWWPIQTYPIPSANGRNLEKLNSFSFHKLLRFGICPIDEDVLIENHTGRCHLEREIASKIDLIQKTFSISVKAFNVASFILISFTGQAEARLVFEVSYSTSEKLTVLQPFHSVFLLISLQGHFRGGLSHCSFDSI